MESLASIGYVLAAIFGFGFVIVIHEFGHFVFAKWAGVRVLRFSVGFGPVLFSRTIAGTEYALSLIPAGGYVRVQGQEDSEPDARAPGSLGAASLGWRALYLAGGVLFNLVSSWLILLCLAWYGMPLLPPVVGGVDTEVQSIRGDKEVVAPSPAVQAGLRRGDRVLSVDGRRIYSFDDLHVASISSGGRPLHLEVRRGEEPVRALTITPVYDRRHGAQLLGIVPATSTRIAARDPRGDGGLRPGERVVAIDGTPVPAAATGLDITDLLTPHLGRQVTLTLERGREQRQHAIRYGGGSPDYRGLGLPVRVATVTAGSPAHDAGLRAGDLALAVDGQAVGSSRHFHELVGAATRAGRPLTVRRARGDQPPADLAITPGEVGGDARIGVAVDEQRTGRLAHLVEPLGVTSGLAAAGLKPGDTVLSIGLKDEATAGIPLRWVRGGQARLVTMPAADRAVLEAGEGALLKKLLDRQVLAKNGDGGGWLRLKDSEGGVDRGQIELGTLSDAGKNALLAGLEPGDWITAWVPVTGDAGTSAWAIEIVRGAGPVAASVATLPDIGVAVIFDTGKEPYQLTHWSEAFSLANYKTVALITATFRLIPNFFAAKDKGGVDATKSVAGPIGIFRMMKQDAELHGFASTLALIALIGLNLVLVNLLPIPLVDGGQLVFVLIEAVIRRPVPVRIQNYANLVGFVLIIAMFVFATSLDIGRLLK